MKKFIVLASLLFPTIGFAQIVQFSGAPVTAACGSSVLDSFAGSTVAISFRKMRAAYSGSGFQAQRTTDNGTQDIGFSGCSPDTAAVLSFAGSFPTLSISTSSSRVAMPSGATVGLINTGSQTIWYNAGNSSVTASTSNTILGPGNLGVITVGANTHVAAVTAEGSSAAVLSNTRIRTFYDQSGNSNSFAQTTQSKQPFYYPNCSTNSLPCAIWCSTCGMSAADSSTYKTAIVNAFLIFAEGLAQITDGPDELWFIGYPGTSSGTIGSGRWAIAANGFGDNIDININGATPLGAEGYGAAYRNKLYQYDLSYSNPNVVFRFNTAAWGSDGGGSVSLSYPNAVGLYLGMNGAGTQNAVRMRFSEFILYGSVQGSRNSISSNQSSYWGVSVPPATFTTSDGFTIASVYFGNFSSSCCGNANNLVTINGADYYTESMWNLRSIGPATNLVSGSMWRFQVDVNDRWDDTERSELDGAADGIWARDLTIQIYDQIWFEAGQAYTSSWNIPGQCHYGDNTATATAFNFEFQNDALSVSRDGAGSFVYTSPTLTRDAWYQRFVEYKISTSGSADVFQVWLIGPGIGNGSTWTQVVNQSGSLFPNDGGEGCYWKEGIYRGTGGDTPFTFAVRVGNITQVNKAVTDISNYRTGSAPAFPSHNFLLRRDLDPAANDNTPMWIDQAA